MEAAIVLSLAASFCTATSSVCQRLGARNSGSSGFDVYLLFRLVRQPIWVLGLGSSWFGSDFIPSGWTYAQRFTYLWTELVPVLAFIVVGTAFWWMGRRTRAEEVPDVAPLP